MPTKYNVISRRNPLDPQAPHKFYPSVVSGGRITLRQLARQISEISTVSTVDTMAVLEALLTIIPREIADGNIVELGEFGSFRLRIQAYLGEEFWLQTPIAVGCGDPKPQSPGLGVQDIADVGNGAWKDFSGIGRHADFNGLVAMNEPNILFRDVRDDPDIEEISDGE